MKKTPEDIRDMFHIHPERFERPLSGVGNERFKSNGCNGIQPRETSILLSVAK